MAFAIGLGPLGVSMVGKYLLFGLWIQLWMPILVISNLYLILVSQRAFEALATQNGAVLPSFRALYESDLLLQTYLGTAGMLIASTPAISLMLIYGSAITATHLAGRLQGADHINEKLTAPDVLQPGAASTTGPLLQTTALGGTHAPGAQGMVWSFKAGQSAQATLKSAAVSAEQAQASFQSAFGQAFAQSAQANHQTATHYALTHTADATYSQAQAAVTGAAEELSRRFSDSGLSTSDMSTLLSAGLKGTLAGQSSKSVAEDLAGDLKTTHGSSSGLAGNLAGQINQKHGVSDTQATEIGLAIAHRAATEQSLRSNFNEGLARGFAEQQGDQYTTGLNQNDTTQLTRSAQNVLSASRSYEQAATFARSVGTDTSYNAIETSGMLRANPAMMARLEHAIDRFGLAGDVAQHADTLLAGGVVGDPAQARAIAGMGLLMDVYGGSRAETMSLGEQQQAEASAMEVYSGLLGVKIPEGIDPQVNADGTIAHVDNGQASVASFRAGARQSVVDQGVVQANQLRAEQQAHLSDDITYRAQLPAPAARIAQEQVGGLMMKMGESGALVRAGLGGVVDEATSTAAASAFGQTLLAGDGWEAAQQAGREAAGSEQGWTAARQAMIDTRLEQVAGHGLTAMQTDLYRAASETSLFAFAPSDAQQAARAAVIAEAPSGATGDNLATLIERSVVSRDDSDLRLIGAYNRTAHQDDSNGPPVTVGRLGNRVLHDPTVTIPASAPSTDDDVKKTVANYNAWYGQANQNQVDLSVMTLNEVKAFQKQLLAQGNGGSAIGRYQIIPDTLDDLTQRLALTGNERWTPELQDRLALTLARDAGINGWIDGRIDDRAFAYNLSKIWAGLPKDASNLSYHDGVGKNAARIDYGIVVGTLAAIRGEASVPAASTSAARAVRAAS
jgi:conjugal transfer mating pair stabilization protein TraG